LTCKGHKGQCSTLQNVIKGQTHATYTAKNAQFHWGVSPPDKWVLFDVKKDPSCEIDLSDKFPELAKTLASDYETWWDEIYPEMISKGGDAKKEH